MSVSSLEDFEQLIIYPLPEDDEELMGLARKQKLYFLKQKKKKKEIAKAKRKMNNEESDQWLRKHCGKPGVDQLTSDELMKCYEWFLSVIDDFNSDCGSMKIRVFVDYLCNLNIFDNQSQVVLFVNMLGLKKSSSELTKVTYPEFRFAFGGCGMNNISKLRELIFSKEKTKKVHRRSSRMLPLHMKSKSGTNSRHPTYDPGSPMKRVTTKAPLVGGGMMYICSPDVAQTSSAVNRPTTAPCGPLAHEQNHFKHADQRSKRKKSIFPIIPPVNQNNSFVPKSAISVRDEFEK